MEPKACVTTKQKHENLDDAISHVRTALYKAEELYNRIRHLNSEGTGLAEPKTESSLHCVLEDGAQILNDTTEQIHVVLNKIEDALF